MAPGVQKTFADAVPNSDPLMILADYRMQRNQSGFDLRHFVELNFTLPQKGEAYVPPAGQSLREHIDGLWPVLTRSTDSASKWDSLLPLPRSWSGGCGAARSAPGASSALAGRVEKASSAPLRAT